MWLAADLAAGHGYSHPVIPVWNALVRLGFFLVTGHFVSENRLLLLRERRLARTDPMTGASNARHFFELLDAERRRSSRTGQPLTLAYLDVDGFKRVNDTLGHPAGDRLLSAVAATLRSCLRSADAVARLGGDEFAVLLPDTPAAGAAAAVAKVRARLQETMREEAWPVTFSVGVVTCSDPARPTREVVAAADRLLYAAKAGGRDAARFAELEPPGRGAVSR